MNLGEERFERAVKLSVDETWTAVEETVEAWGAEWDRENGALLLPLAAGVRSGMARCRLDVDGAAGGARLTLTVLERHYQLRRDAVVVLAVSALGGVLTVIWPIFPKLLPFAPFGAVLALLGWFLVVSKLVTNSPEQFLEAVAQEPAVP